MTALDAALLPALFAALSLVPLTLACCHLARALASLAAPVASDLSDVVSALLAWVRPMFRPSHCAPTLVCPLSGVLSVDLPLLLAFV